MRWLAVFKIFRSLIASDVCIFLKNRYEEEKDALLAALRGADDKLKDERERQAALARLRREERQARQEDNFYQAAMVLGLAQALQTNLEEVYVAAVFESFFVMYLINNELLL